MRTAFIETLIELAHSDERIFLLTGDLGWTVVETFAARFPERFLNVGVAEQNMAGIATGLAQTGFVPFVYSIATFASMRSYEQFRNGPILHELPVRLVGIGGGYAYGHAGPTHYALEDLAIWRAQPGIAVIAPADPAQTREVMRATKNSPGPLYLRIGKGGNQEVSGLDGRFALGRPEMIRQGRQLLFLASGSIVHEALSAASLLDEKKIPAAVAVMAHLPFTASVELIDCIAGFEFIITVEEGYVVGGLGSLVAETIAQHLLSCHLSMQGVKNNFSCESSSEKYMRARQGLNAEHLAETALKLLGAH